ncbi:chemotaxis protein MotB [Aquimarina amphilecti]|uniref:Chemotaxis protein MotB n=1 Tax=Aquimarina amphilecti TaxID=1038014 RepID=A0A1H7X917_AQUAM|nr:OmpA family protein [Aquimarina amphilecti]SEM30124.1 chemotaxis protein MotB [Aquimarina amphilecti]
MRKIILLASVLMLTNSFVHAQKKKDLIAEIDKLRSELKGTQGELTEAKKNERVSQSKVKTMEAQVADLKDTNASLLANMNSFTELSNKKATNLQTSQEIIKSKDKQLNVINDAITANDSTNLAVFSQFKNAIGGDNIKIGGSTIFIILPNTTLFGENDKNYIVDEKAKSTLEKIAATLNANPNLTITVEGNSNALKLDGKKLIDNWDLSSRQAASVVRVLQTDYKVDPKRMEALGKSEYGTEGIETVTKIIINPKFDKFYNLVKDNMKN